MSRKIEYHHGDIIGDYGIIFLEEIEPVFYKSSGYKRRAKFKCPYCGSEFKNTIEQIKSNKTKSCGCQQGAEAIRRSLDLTGKKFGRLTAIKAFSIPRKDKKPIRKWLCKCDCGNDVLVPTNSLTSGHTKSCGCLKQDVSKETHIKDITNLRSGLLIAQYRLDKQDDSGNFFWHCSCDCGGSIEVRATDIITNRIVSCGCLVSRGETKIKRILTENNIDYIPQCVFDDCINPQTGAKLKFDFYLPDYDCCIEYDGKQHFIESGTWAEKEGLNNIQKRDGIKDSFCKDNSILLVRIPYTDYELLDYRYIKNKIQQKGEE